MTKGCKHSMKFFMSPPSTYFSYGATKAALEDLTYFDLKRIFVMTNRTILELNHVQIVKDKLDEIGLRYEVHCDVTATRSSVDDVMNKLTLFNPDCIVGIGPCDVLDVAKLVRCLYTPQHESTVMSMDVYKSESLEDLFKSDKLMHHGSRSDDFIKKLILVPTLDSQGTEMTPMSWIRNDSKKYIQVVNQKLVPDIVIGDAFFSMKCSKSVIAASGMAAFCNSVESAVSNYATDFSLSFAHRAIKLLCDNLAKCYDTSDLEFLSKCHTAISLSGMAAANSFYGICKALSVAFEEFMLDHDAHISYGQAASLFLTLVVSFNSTNSKEALKHYVTLTESSGIASKCEKSDEDTVKEFINYIQTMKKQLDLTSSIANMLNNMNVSEDAFTNAIPAMATRCLEFLGCNEVNSTAIIHRDVVKFYEQAFHGTICFTH